MCRLKAPALSHKRSLKRHFKRLIMRIHEHFVLAFAMCRFIEQFVCGMIPNEELACDKIQLWVKL